MPYNEIQNILNQALVSGVRVLDVYDNGSKLKHLSLLHCQVFLEYDRGIPENASADIIKLFAQDNILVTKKTKNGPRELNIAPMIRNMNVNKLSDKQLCLDALICCQNPTLNPAQLISAISAYLSNVTPDFSRCLRVEIFDANENVFR